jgi:hypothetical protein
MLTRLTLYIAYSIKTSEWHRRNKTFCYDLLENPVLPEPPTGEMCTFPP